MSDSARLQVVTVTVSEVNRVASQLSVIDYSFCGMGDVCPFTQLLLITRDVVVRIIRRIKEVNQR